MVNRFVEPHCEILPTQIIALLSERGHTRVEFSLDVNSRDSYQTELDNNKLAVAYVLLSYTMNIK